jgi:hypothetical protein
MVKIIPISRAYREGHEKIRWGGVAEPVVEPSIIVPDEPEHRFEAPKVYPAVGWVLGECNYQGC